MPKLFRTPGEVQASLGKTQIAISRLPSGMRPMASSNQAALQLARQGTKDLIEGTRKINIAGKPEMKAGKSIEIKHPGDKGVKR